MEWLAGTEADVVCLQEVRAEPDQLPDEVRSPRAGTPCYAPAAAKGRAGVSLLHAARAGRGCGSGFGAGGVRRQRALRRGRICPV